MPRLALPTLALALCSTLAFGQTTATPAPQQDAPAPVQRMHPRNPQKEVAHLTKRFNLTPDQQSKLEPIFADRDQKIDAVRANTSLTPQDAESQVHAITKNANKQLATILTPEQMQQMHANHKGRGKEQTQPLNPPPSA